MKFNHPLRLSFEQNFSDYFLVDSVELTLGHWNANVFSRGILHLSLSLSFRFVSFILTNTKTCSAMQCSAAQRSAPDWTSRVRSWDARRKLNISSLVWHTIRISTTRVDNIMGPLQMFVRKFVRRTHTHTTEHILSSTFRYSLPQPQLFLEGYWTTQRSAAQLNSTLENSAADCRQIRQKQAITAFTGLQKARSHKRFACLSLSPSHKRSSLILVLLTASALPLPQSLRLPFRHICVPQSARNGGPRIGTRVQ